ncbi:hypothetical protein HY496_03680 [Candidatus Woesearchaeota archaeon]|nr:hypothetical protein [Candidatus Woesearchaeota archaeon]
MKKSEKDAANTGTKEPLFRSRIPNSSIKSIVPPNIPLQKVPPQEKTEVKDQPSPEPKSAQKLSQANPFLPQKTSFSLPEMATEDLEGLSEEGREILRVGRGLRQKENAKAEIGGAERVEQKKAPSRDHPSELEQQLQHEQASFQPRQAVTEYAPVLSQQPLETIYHEMTSLYQRAEEKGYLNQEEQRRVQYLSSAVEKKVQDAEEHRYEMTEEKAAVVGITRQIGAKLKDLYKGTTEYQHQYRFN